MVRRFSAISYALLVAGILLPVQPSRADDILDLIQNQVSGIVAKTTGGIVTIEDQRGIELEDSWREALRSRPRGLRHRLTDALKRLSDADIQVAVVRATVKPAGVALAEALKSRNAIAAEV